MSAGVLTVQEGAIYLATMGAATSFVLSGYSLIDRAVDWLAERMSRHAQAKAEVTAKALDELFMNVQPAWLKTVYAVGPVAAGAGTYVVTHQALPALLASAAGALIPDLWVKEALKRRRKQFRAQLVDALFVLSSSLKAGLSMAQAFEQLESEMSPPASQEFGLMIKAHRLGLSLEESLNNLNKRMACEEMELITTAILVARETGGDVTTVLSQLIATIRDRKKLLDKVNTMTIMGRVQGYIIGGLPFAFAWFVKLTNPQHFQALLDYPEGRVMLLIAAALWAVGLVLVRKLSKVRV
jgi:tight adherence protein B